MGVGEQGWADRLQLNSSELTALGCTPPAKQQEPPFGFSPGSLIVPNYTDASHMQIVHEGFSF